jgi:hypothetical protein
MRAASCGFPGTCLDVNTATSLIIVEQWVRQLQDVGKRNHQGAQKEMDTSYILRMDWLLALHLVTHHI